MRVRKHQHGGGGKQANERMMWTVTPGSPCHCYSGTSHCDGGRSHERGDMGPTAQTPTHQGHARPCCLNVQPAHHPQRPVLSPGRHRLASGASQLQRPVHPGRASVHLRWDEAGSGYGFAFPDHRASASTSQDVTWCEGKESHQHSIGTQRGPVERQLVAPSVPLGSCVLGPGGLSARDQQEEPGLVCTMGAGRKVGGTQVIPWAPQGTPTVIVQGHGQRPRPKKGVITRHVGPPLPAG